MEPDFMSDAYDDLAADQRERQLSPPVVFDVPRDFVPRMIAAREALAADSGFLQIVDPVLFLIRGTMQARVQYHTVPYFAAQAQARGVRHNAYSEGVVKPPHRMTRAEKARRDRRQHWRPAVRVGHTVASEGDSMNTNKPRGTWSFLFRLPDGSLPCIGGKQSDSYDNTIYATKAQGTSRKEAEKQARATVAKRAKVAINKLKLSSSRQVDISAVEIDGGLDE